MPEMPDYRQLYSSVLEGFDALNLIYFTMKVIYDSNGKPFDLIFTEANPAVERLMHKSKEEIVGKGRKQIFGSLFDDFPEKFDKILKTGKPLHFQTFGSGLKKYYEIYAWKLTDQEVAGFLVDITPQKSAEEALRLSEAHYRTLFSRIGEGFELMELIFDENKAVCDLRYLEVNETYEKQTGLKAKDVLGKTVRELFPKIEGMWVEVFDKVVKTGLPTRLEDYHKDTQRYYSAYYFPFGKKEVGVLFSDITERKKAEEALKESEQRWSTTLSSIGDAVIATDLSGKILFMNGEAEKLTGWLLIDATQNSVKTVFNIIDEKTHLEVESPIERVLRDGMVVGLANHTLLIQRDGKEIPIDDSAAPIRSKDGKNTGVVLVFRDITKRRQDEQEHERLSAIVETTDDAIIGKTLEGIITSWNQAAEKMYGYTANEMIGKSISLVIPAGHNNEFQQILERLGRGEKIEHHDTVRLRKDDTRMDVDVTVAPIKNRYGEIVGASTIAREITERKKAEQELKRSEENARQRAEELRKLMDIIPAAVWLSRDPECKVIVGNQAANTFYEAEGEENVSAGPARGKAQDTTRRFFRNGKELMPQELPMQEAAAKNVEIKNSELEVIVPSGRKIAILGNAKPLLDDAGNVRGCLGAFVDITERKKAEETLTKKQDELQTIIDSSQGLIFYKDRENHFIRVNKAFAKIMGLPKEQLEGRSLFEIYPKEEAEAFWNDDKKVIASGKAKVGIEEKMQSKQGQRWVQTDKIPYRDAEGNIIGVIGFAVDITERKQAEEALSRINEELEERVQKRTQEVSSERQRLYNVLETLPAYVVLLDKDYRCPLPTKSSGKLSASRMADVATNTCSDVTQSAKTVKHIKFSKPMNPSIGNGQDQMDMITRFTITRLLKQTAPLSFWRWVLTSLNARKLNDKRRKQQRNYKILNV